MKNITNRENITNVLIVHNLLLQRILLTQIKKQIMTKELFSCGKIFSTVAGLTFLGLGLPGSNRKRRNLWG